MLADKIRARRKVLDISQQQLARISGIAQSSISRYENGEGGITLEYIVKLANVLECSPLYLVSDEFGITADMEEQPSSVTPKELAVLRKNLKECLNIIGE